MDRMDSARMLRDALQTRFGGRLRKMLVFGSTARGCASEGSDIDVLVVVDGGEDWRTARAVRDAATVVELAADAVFDLKTTSDVELATLAGRTPFMKQVFMEGVAV
jgi:predicted nucleotidyltransferase